MMATLAFNELINDYTNEKFCEVIWFFSYKALNFFIISSDKLDKKRNIGKFFCRLLIINSFSPVLQNLANLMPETRVLFQIEVFGRNIKDTTLARYFIKVTARPSFTRLTVIMIR